MSCAAVAGPARRSVRGADAGALPVGGADGGGHCGGGYCSCGALTRREASYQAWADPQCGQPTDVVTAALKT